MCHVLIPQVGGKLLMWKPPQSKIFPLPEGHRLLATGEVVDDDIAYFESTQISMVVQGAVWKGI